MIGDAVAVAVASGGFVGVLALAEAGSRRWKLEAELARKSAHVACGIGAAALPLVMSFGAVAVLALLFIPFMLWSRRVELFPSLHQVERSSLGEIYFPLGVLLAALVVPERVPYSYGILVMALSDAVASLAGQRYGHRAYRILTSWKTYAGSAAFLAVTLVLSVGALVVAGDNPLAAVWLAPVLTGAEGALGGGTDNVVLPVMGAGLLALVT